LTLLKLFKGQKLPLKAVTGKRTESSLACGILCAGQGI